VKTTNDPFNCPHCGTEIYRTSFQAVNESGHHNPGGDACVRTLKKNISSLKQSLAAFESETDPRCAEVQKKGEGNHVTSCKCNKPALAAIEFEHLDILRTLATRLYTETRLNGDEMRDAAYALMNVIRHAEVLDAMRKPGEPTVHVCPAMDKKSGD
jgi:hypothetical protein